MDLGGFLWMILKFAGPVILLAAIAWAILHNRTTRRQRAATERATERVYEQEERARGREGDAAP